MLCEKASLMPDGALRQGPPSRGAGRGAGGETGCLIAQHKEGPLSAAAGTAERGAMARAGENGVRGARRVARNDPLARRNPPVPGDPYASDIVHSRRRMLSVEKERLPVTLRCSEARKRAGAPRLLDASLGRARRARGGAGDVIETPRYRAVTYVPRPSRPLETPRRTFAVTRSSRGSATRCASPTSAFICWLLIPRRFFSNSLETLESQRCLWLLNLLPIIRNNRTSQKM
ncbi:hypothetical protein AAFF_G00095580 [Aldrovandia affinis]|uniref:Uncharacterized protein n=1 Tax=Aldrovandia affinis TaxID=143900 RepID=A0AAD7RVL5_9TELE|nr:hypothetical protein AAFF_G00095580 [Aldrovandia affinis]